jgi:predicted DNA-binding antitoxin AbrB/MazE fold protein
MLEFELNAVYENGVLKLERPLELKEGQKVRVVVRASRARQSQGLVEWTGDPEALRRFALDPDLDLEASP